MAVGLFNFLKPGTINALNSRVQENWEIGERFIKFENWMVVSKILQKKKK